MQATVKKKFDCVEMKRQAQAKAWAPLKGMNEEQRLAYFRKQYRLLEREKRQAEAKLSHAVGQAAGHRRAEERSRAQSRATSTAKPPPKSPSKIS